MARIAAVAPVLPQHSYTQQEITRELAPLLTSAPSRQLVLERMHAASGIGTRHTALPLERYRSLGSFRETNDTFIAVAADLAERALTVALAEAGVAASDIDFVLFTSVTGISAPSVDAIVASRLGLRSDVKRLPSFGLGCVGGAAGIARVNDYLAGHPGGVGVLLSVELCSLTLQRDDESMANFVATGLFGDGGAAVVMLGDEHPLVSGAASGPGRIHPGPRVVATRSALYPETSDVIGFLVGGTGFEIVLTAEVADVISEHFPRDVAAFLSAQGLTLDDISTWVAHPGGPRILEAFEQSLDLEREQLAASWGVLDRVGNLSSAAVLHVLDAVTPKPGYGLLFALGPGVSAEFVLLEWDALDRITA